MMRALIRRLHRDESGLSLTEILVSTMLTLLVLIMVGNMFIAATRITAASNQTRTSNDVATNIVNEVASVLRVSTDLIKADDSVDYAVVEGSRSKVTVFTLSNTSAATPAPSKVTFELVAVPVGPATPAGFFAVKETRCPGALSGTVWTFATACTTRDLGIGVMQPDTVDLNADGAPDNQLFTYRNAAGAPILIGTGLLSSTDRNNVASITVTVRSQAVKAKTPPVIVTNTVVLRNLGLDTST